ncbi:uncharacterized protein LOC134767483 [Penaeus indicus]|uniref:uncharacterized protein LOC134767483 n=1 Tax=Penaeus indicus TaxID=29960 RepID=UPI00300CB798
MGTRRDNRLSEGGPVRPLHVKQDHDRRNQELLKQLSNGTAPSKRPPPSSSAYMSKSLTLELEKGLQGSSAKAHGKKSYLRQTSSSVMRSSHGGGEKDAPAAGRRKRDASPSKAPNNRLEKKASPGGDAPRRADVFERLSKVDSNKSSAGHRLPRDRSPQKGGRRSPQERNSLGERSQSGRKTSSQGRRRDASPTKGGGEAIRGGNKRALVGGGAGRGAPPALKNDEDVDSSAAKLAQENIPESVDKDLDDPPARASVGGPAGPSRGAGEAVTRPASLGVTPPKVEGRGEASSPGAGDSSLRTPTEAPAKQRHVAKEQSAPSRRDRAGDPKTPPERRARTAEKPPAPQEAPAARTKPKKAGMEVARLPSPAEVIQKVRERVSDGSPTSKAPPGVDDDKDVCEADKAEDEREFYRISVQTRLVSYNNSTLVIKNTSKAAAVGDNAHSDAEADSAEATLQSSSAAAAGAGAAAADVEADTDAPRCHPAAEAGDGGLFRTGSLRGKLSTFVSKGSNIVSKGSDFVSRGRNFLCDVYSATHSRLAARIAGSDESGPSTRSASPCSAASFDGDDLRVGGARDSDSGYFSISEGNPGFLRRHVRAASWHCPSAYRGMPGASPLPPCPPASSSSTSASSGGAAATTETQTKVRGEPAMEAETVARPEGADQGGAERKEGGDGAAKGPTVDEDWIKKNILCTCKCQRRAEGVAGQTEESVAGRTEADTDNADADEAQSGANCESMISESSATESEAQEEEEEEEEEMCFCSCHEVGPDGHVLQHLPEEVKELLDADHASRIHIMSKPKPVMP